MKNKYIESFSTSDNEYAKNKILDDCQLTWGKMNSSNGEDICSSSAWLTNPNLLCGICGYDNHNPLHSLKASDGSTLYGCSKNNPNPYQLSWDPLGNKTTKINDVLSNILTCNSYNSGATADMMLFICFDDYCTITINGKGTNQSGWNTQGTYYYTKIKYGDSVKIVGTNVSGPGGLAMSYIWNKQLFILDNNGFQNSANIIDYVATGATGWDNNTWAAAMPTIPPWMKNFMTCQYCNDCSGNCKTTLTLEFKVGYTKKSQINSDVNMFLGIDDQGIVYKNNTQVYNKSQSWNNTVNFVIPNVNENDNIDIQCNNTYGGPGGLGVLYLWYGFIFSFPQNTISGFNNCVNLINITSSSNITVNTYNYTYHQNGPGYFWLMPNWLYTTNSQTTFDVQFKMNFSTFVSNGLIMYYTFDAISNKKFYNNVTKVYDATAYNNSTINTTLQKKGTGCLSLPGSSGLNLPSITITGDTSICFWLYCSTNVNYYSYIFDITNIATITLGYYMYIHNNQLTIGKSGGPGEYIFANKIANNTWAHIVITSTSSGTTMYLNGQITSTSSSSIKLPTGTYNYPALSSDFHNTQNPNVNYVGYMDDFRIYNRALNISEITSIYNLSG